MNIYSTTWCQKQLFASQNDALGNKYLFKSFKILVQNTKSQMSFACQYIFYWEGKCYCQKKRAKSVSWWYTRAWFRTSRSCVEPHLIVIAAKLLFHQDPWAPQYRRHEDKQTGDEARPRHQLFCCLEEIFVNILIRSHCTTGSLTFHIMLIRASTFFQKNTAANQKFCGEQQQNGDVLGGGTREDVRHVRLLRPQLGQTNSRPTRAGGKVGERRRQILPSGPGGCHSQCNLFHIQQVGREGGGSVIGVGMGINSRHWWQEVMAGLNLERKEVEMCHLDSSLTYEKMHKWILLLMNNIITRFNIKWR